MPRVCKNDGGYGKLVPLSDFCTTPTGNHVPASDPSYLISHKIRAGGETCHPPSDPDSKRSQRKDLPKVSVPRGECNGASCVHLANPIPEEQKSTTPSIIPALLGIKPNMNSMPQLDNCHTIFYRILLQGCNYILKAHVCKHLKIFASNLYPRVIIPRNCRHLSSLQSTGMEKEVASLLLLPFRSADLIKTPQRPQVLNNSSVSSRKRKPGQEAREAGCPSSQIEEQPPAKRPLILPPSYAAAAVLMEKEERSEESANDIVEATANPLV